MGCKFTGVFALFCAIGSVANATVVASFPDPSPSPAAPDLTLYFTSKGQQVQGQWDWNGPYLMPLRLSLPLQNKTLTNVLMSMPRMNVGGGGSICFTDVLGNSVMTVTFDKAVFFGNNRYFGGGPSTGSSVIISGPGMPTYTGAYFQFVLDRSGRIAMNTYGIDAGFSCGF